MSGSSTKRLFIQEVPKSLFEKCLEDPERRVAVLGSPNNWPYIHKVCVDIVSSGFVAVTDRYIYKPSEDPDSGYYRVQYDKDEKSRDDFIKENLIGRSKSAIIIYPVGKEDKFAEFCASAGLKTMGLTFVGTIYEDNYCKECVLDSTTALTYCCYQGNSSNCVPSQEACPFKEQDIASTDLSHFFKSKGKMVLIAVEKLEKTAYIIDDFLNEQFSLPMKLPHVFEFRFDIPDEKYCGLLNKFDELQKDKEDRVSCVYEYIDYFYKPKGIAVEQWLDKKESMRVREWKNPIGRQPIVYYSDIQPTTEGFYCKQAFGGQILFEGELNQAKGSLANQNMEPFLKTIKMGRFYYLQNGKLGDIRFKAYLESVEVELPGEEKQKYGYSMEIEIWTDKPKKVEEVSQRRAEIVKLLGLDGCTHQANPMQELAYRWITKNKE